MTEKNTGQGSQRKMADTYKRLREMTNRSNLSQVDDVDQLLKNYISSDNVLYTDSKHQTYAQRNKRLESLSSHVKFSHEKKMNEIKKQQEKKYAVFDGTGPNQQFKKESMATLATINSGGSQSNDFMNYMDNQKTGMNAYQKQVFGRKSQSIDHTNI